MSRQQPNRNPCPLPDRDSVRRLLEYLDNFNKLDENADSKSLYQTFSNNLELSPTKQHFLTTRSQKHGVGAFLMS